MNAMDAGQGAIEALRSGRFLPLNPDNSTDTTSGLSIDEQLSIEQVGFEPQDIVNGAAVARLGYNGKNTLRPFSNFEVRRLSELLGTARERAVQEMEKQCADIEAAGVIGVRLDLQGTERDGLATFVATGTAVRSIGPKAELNTKPFTSSLSGQDFHLLLRSGCAPVGFVAGTSVFHFGWRSLRRWAASQGRCLELTSLTTSLYAARESAVQQLRTKASLLGADGVIGVKVIERPNVWGSHVIEFVAYGTAIGIGKQGSDAFDPAVLVLLNDEESSHGLLREDTFGRPDPGPGART